MADEQLISQILARWEMAREGGQDLTADDLCVDSPELTPIVRRKIEALEAFPRKTAHGAPTAPNIKAPPGQHRPPPVIPGYEILGELGRGGMGVVYKARHVKLDRIVALKMILVGGHAKEDDLARFRLEAEAVARLQHPNIVQIFEVGDHEGLPFFSLEFVEGGTLDKHRRGAPQSARHAALSVMTLARAIQYAHERGVVHRDLKPGNVLLAADGSPKVTDFGLAKRLDSESGQTRTGTVLGTPCYMAPEQAQSSKDVGRSADIYSLGAVLYDLLTARPPFVGTSAWDTIRKVISDEPVSPTILQPNIPHDLETICLKCLHKDPARRFASAQELAEDLGRFLRGEPIQARSVGRAERTWRWCRRNPLLAASGAVASVALIAVAVVSLWFAVHARRAASVLSLALDDSKKSQRIAEERLAENSLDHGVKLSEEGDAGQGLLWLARSLTQVPKGSDALADAIRTRIDGWSGDLPILRACVDHPWPITAVAFAPDGKSFLVAGGSFAQRYDATGGRLGLSLDHGKPITAAALADATTFATAGEDRVVRFWNAIDGRSLGKKLTHSYPLTALAFSANGRVVVTGGGNLLDEGGVARVWNVADGTPIGKPLAHRQPVWAVAIDKAGERILTGSGPADHTEPGVVSLWQIADGQRLAELPHAAGVQAVAFSPDGRIIGTGGAAGRVRFWNARNHKQTVSTSPPHDGAIQALAFAPDGQSVATGGSDQQARLWSVVTGRPMSPPLRARNTVYAVAFSSDGRWLLTGGADRTARLWELPTPIALRHEEGVVCVAFHPEGNTVLTGGRDKVAQLWSVETGKPQGPPLRHEKVVNRVAFSPDGKIAATASADGTARLWDPSSGKPIGPALRHKAYVAAVAFSPDGKRLATASHDHTARLWDVHSGELLGGPLEHADQVTALAFSADGKRLATGCDDHTARQWEVATGKRIGEPLRHTGRVVAVAFHPRDMLILTGAEDQRAQLWDADTSKPVCPPLRHEGAVTAVSFRPDGQTAMTGSDDRTARLWSVKTGRLQGFHMPHKNVVKSVAFSPDGTLAVTASADGTARLWDSRTGLPLGAPLRHQKAVVSVAISSDSRTVATASVDGTARLWHRPRAMPGDPRRIATWVEIITGTELAPGGVLRVLDAPMWRERVARHDKE